MENPYELIYLSRTGDEDAFPALLHQIEPLLRVEVNRLISANEGFEIYREDMLMESYISVYDAVNAYREDIGAGFTTFCMRVVRNRLCCFVRRNLTSRSVRFHRTVPLEDYASDPDGETRMPEQRDRLSEPVYAMRMNQAAERLDHIISRMNPRDREVLSAWMDGKTYRQAGQELSMTERQFGSRKERIRKKVINTVLHGD